MNQKKKLATYFTNALDFWEQEQSAYLSNLPIAKSRGCLQAFIFSQAFFERYKEDIHYGSKSAFLGKVQSRMMADLLEITKKDWFWQEIYAKFKDFIEINTEQRKGSRNFIQKTEELTPTPYLSLTDMTEGERGVFSNRADWLQLHRKIDEMNKVTEGIESGTNAEGATLIRSNWLTTQDYRVLNRILVSWPSIEWKLNEYLDKYRNLFYNTFMGASWSGQQINFMTIPPIGRSEPSGKTGGTGEDYVPTEEGEDKPFDHKLPYEENLKNRIANLQREWKVAGANDQKIIEKNINSCHRLIKAWQKHFKISTLAEFKKKMETVVGFSKVKQDMETFVDLYNDYGEKLPQQFICLLGDPGVGKSYISGIIAEAMDWGYVNVNVSKAELSELIGSDPTYRGSSYGKIIQGMIDYETRNLVIILDEFEKAKKTEVLEMISIITDVTKNWKDFDDNYFGFPVPLNNCLIILTGNKEIPIPSHIESRLKGNMVEISPLTYAERLQIVKIELKKVLDNFGIGSYMDNFSDELLGKCITETWGIRESKTNAQKLAMQLAVLVKKGNAPRDFDSHNWSLVEVRDDNFDKSIIEDWPDD